MIAMAIACDPDLLIADEPTTALDVTIQAQILEVLEKAADETHSSIMMITHDLGVVAGMADRVAVMYAGPGRRGGRASTRSSTARACPTRGGCSSRSPGWTSGAWGGCARSPARRRRCIRTPTGCRFHPRCPYSDEEMCVFVRTELLGVGARPAPRCHFAVEPGWVSPTERLTTPPRRVGAFRARRRGARTRPRRPQA